MSRARTATLELARPSTDVRADNAEFYPGLVEPEDLVMRKTGFSAVTSGNCEIR